MIKLYGHKRCKMVKPVESYLRAKGIQYTYINTDKSQEAREFVMMVNDGFLSVPTLLFPDGSTLTEPDFSEIDAALSQWED